MAQVEGSGTALKRTALTFTGSRPQPSSPSPWKPAWPSPKARVGKGERIRSDIQGKASKAESLLLPPLKLMSVPLFVGFERVAPNGLE